MAPLVYTLLLMSPSPPGEAKDNLLHAKTDSSVFVFKNQAVNHVRSVTHTQPERKAAPFALRSTFPSRGLGRHANVVLV